MFGEFFDLVYVLNLPNRADRLQHVQHELAKLGIALGTDRVRRFEAIRPTDAGGFPSVGARGALLSHQAALRSAMELGAARPLILEDDVAFTPLLLANQDSVCTQLAQQAWDIVQIGHMTEHNGRPRPTFSPDAADRGINFEVCRGEVIGAHCYSMAGARIEVYLDFLDRIIDGSEKRAASSGPMPIDGTFNVFSWRADVTRLIARPSLAQQISSRSDVTPHRLDQIGPLRPALSIARRLGLNRGRRG